ncbi:unnamed protein product [Scytosiphon promiscuus]
MEGAAAAHATSPKEGEQGKRASADEDSDTACAAGAGSVPAQQAGHDNNNNAHLFVFSNSKAGMKNVDKERVNRVIYEMSKNSSFFKQAQRQDQKLDSKVAEMKVKLGALDLARKAQLTRQADRIATDLEAQRELDSVCLVIDMDMFYAAVEIRDRPELKDQPVAVGGESMISTTNYHARLKGVRSAMPGFIGRKLCPELVFVKPDYKKYTVVAEQIRDIFREYDPRMRSYSLDEAYLNVTQVLARRLGLEESASATAGGTKTAVGMGDGVDRKDEAGEAKAAAAASPLGDRSVYGKPGTATGLVGGMDGSRIGSGTRRRPRRDAGAMRVDEEEEQEGEEEEEEDGEGRHGSVGDGGVCAGDGARAGESHEGRSLREERRARMFEAARGLAEEIRGRIRQTTKLTASVGIGPNFMLAKIASDWNKPDGQMCIGGDRAEVLRFLHDLPVRKIGGVGKVQEKCLREAMGVVTCGDLFRERAACLHVMTPHTSKWLIKVSLGIASADHDVATEQAQAAGAITRKQIRRERTFGELHRPQDLLDKCREICDSLAAEMAAKGLEAKTVGLKVKTTKFQVRTLDSTGQTYVRASDELYATASALLQKEIRGAATSAPGGKLRLRLMGIRASGFRGQAGAPIQPGQATLDGFLRTAATTDKASEAREENRTSSAVRDADYLAGGLARGPDRAWPAVSRSPRSITPSQTPELWETPSSRIDGAQAAATAAAEASVSCPMCGEELGSLSNAALNRHVDACLGVCTTPAEESASIRSGGGGFPPRESRDTVPSKRAKVSAAGIERFLTTKERT